MKTQPTAMHPQKLIVSWSVLKELLPLMTLGSIDAAGSPTQTRTLKRIMNFVIYCDSKKQKSMSIEMT